MENSDKKNKRIKILIIVLVIICMAQGVTIYYLFRPDRKITGNIDDFSKLLHKKFSQDQKSQWDRFDRFFDDDFFNKERDPFEELEKFHKRMEKMLSNSLNDSFDLSWDSWLQDRFLVDSDQIDIKTTENEKEYIITMNVRNLKDNKLVIDIDKNGIAIQGDFTQVLEKKDSAGRVISKQEKRRSISKKLPIPDDADHERADIEHQDNEIVITIPKKVG